VPGAKTVTGILKPDPVKAVIVSANLKASVGEN